MMATDDGSAEVKSPWVKKSSSSGLKCPTCGEPAAAPAKKGGSSPRPFCSRRCADVDLGRWFQGAYAIPAVDAADDSIIKVLPLQDNLSLGDNFAEDIADSIGGDFGTDDTGESDI